MFHFPEGRSTEKTRDYSGRRCDRLKIASFWQGADEKTGYRCRQRHGITWVITARKRISQGTGKLPCMTVHDRATAVRNRAKFHGKRTVCMVVVQYFSLLHGRHLMNKEAARLRSISQ